MVSKAKFEIESKPSSPAKGGHKKGHGRQRGSNTKRCLVGVVVAAVLCGVVFGVVRGKDKEGDDFLPPIVEDDVIHEVAISTPSGTSRELERGTVKLVKSGDALTSDLVTLECREKNNPNSVYQQGGRSYDGRDFESSPPLFVSFTCDECNAGTPCVCTMKTPETKTCRIKSYEIAGGEPTAAQRAARFLLKTTFGPTQAEIDNFPATNKEYFEAQVAKAVGSHRQYYRENSNDRKLSATASGDLVKPCDVKSRWSRYIFSNSDVGGSFTTTPGSLTVTTMYGTKSTELGITPCDSAGAPPYNICGVENTGEDFGGLVYYGEDCSCQMANLNITLTTPPPGDIVDSSGDLVDLTPPVVGAALLNTVDDDCVPLSHAKSYAYMKKRNSDDHWYLYDPRQRLHDNDSSSSPPTNGMCESVQKTFLNAHSCVPAAKECSPRMYTRDVEIILTPELLRKYFTLSGMPVHYMTGLRLDEEKKNQLAYSDAAVCESKRATRWLREVGACGGDETPVGGDLDSTTKAFLAKQLNASSANENNDQLTVIDIPVAKDEDDCVLAKAGVKITVEEGDKTYCYEQVHEHTHNVYDFTAWSASHPGNVQARDGFRSNPIDRKAWVEGVTEFHFPSWHEMSNWSTHQRSTSMFSQWKIGKLYEKINFADLPTFAQTAEIAAEVGSTITADRVDDYYESCGSPYEVANDPAKGARYTLTSEEKDQVKFASNELDQYMGGGSFAQNGKSQVWLNKVLKGDDQLRQRVAWALSQIFVISEDGVNKARENEVFHTFYDIFVRNAFGSFLDILREVSYSPTMGIMLTFLEGQSLQFNQAKGSMVYPDENYAREIMQLFTIGLFKLNMDGTRMTDENGEFIPTYTNDDIMSLSRAWTGFTKGVERGNIENRDGDGTWNELDPMNLNEMKRDKFPKRGLDGHFIGDGYPLCRDLPSRPFLKKGAKYRFLGSSYYPELKIRPGGNFDVYDTPGLKRFNVSSTDSNLGRFLYNDGNFHSIATVTANLDCTDHECDVETVNVIELLIKNQPPAYYEYIQVPCVEFTFFEGGHIASNKNLKNTFCADARLPMALGGCCHGDVDTALYRRKRVNLVCRDTYWNERTTWNKVVERCEAKGLTVCQTHLESGGEHAGPDVFNSAMDGSCFLDDTIKHWMSTGCETQVQVFSDGSVSVVHRMDEKSTHENRMFEVKAESATSWKVDFMVDGDAIDFDVPAGLYNATVNDDEIAITNMNAFDREKLYIGAPDPESFDVGFYSISNTLSTPDVTVWTAAGEEGVLSASTIFEIIPFHGDTLYYKNVKSTVSFELDDSKVVTFRNTPTLVSVVEFSVQKAMDETEAVIKHYFHHPNTAPFIADFLIKRFTSSNASPAYTLAVAEAFTDGIYDGIGGGSYGDLKATMAAVLLHPEANAESLTLDPNHGKLREQLLKVVQLLRSLEFNPDNGRDEPSFNDMTTKIGMAAYESPSVFNFFQNDYSADVAAVAKIVAPESQILSTPTVLGYINGVLSLFEFGFSSCDSGFGIRNQKNGDCWRIRNGNEGFNKEDYWGGSVTFAPSGGPEVLLEKLDLLLNGGRLSEKSRDVILNAMRESAGAGRDSLVTALELMAASPEFQVENALHEPQSKREVGDTTTEEDDGEIFDADDYKAIIYIFMPGGMDSYNLLIPHSECTGEFDLQQQYQDVRTDVALSKASLLQIDGEGQAQPCNKFGINPAAPYLKTLYDEGDLSFVANIGTLIEPLADKDEYKNANKQIPNNLFAHNSQQVAITTAHAQDTSSAGILGKIKDAMRAYNSQGGRKESTHSYSIEGNQRAVVGEAGISPGAKIISKNVGVIPFDQHNVLPHLKEPLLELVSNVSKGVFAETWASMVEDSVISAEKLASKLEDGGELQQEFAAAHTADPSNLAKQLEKVANVVAARSVLKANRDLFVVQIGGFDTHNDATETLTTLLGEINEAMVSLVEELKLQGVWDQTTVISASEFGRTMNSNGLGTDHGWGGNMWLAGGEVDGGKIHGQYPRDIRPESYLDSGRGRIIPTTPWESIWHAVAQWFGVEGGEVMQRVLPNIENFPDIFGEGDIYQ